MSKKAKGKAPDFSSDPVLAFIKRMSSSYTYGYLPDGSKLEDPATMRKDLAERTQALLDILGHSHARKLAGTYPKPMLDRLAAGKRGAGHHRHPVTATREILLALLRFTRGVHDYLNDCEREIWVLLQLTHDPRVANMRRTTLPASIKSQYITRPDGKGGSNNTVTVRWRRHMRKKELDAAQAAGVPPPPPRTMACMEPRKVAWPPPE
jgi:hypothetical protein